MKREIKFRLWDKEFSEFSQYHLSRMNVGDLNNSLVLKRFIIDQYTGLKDKKGIEIYEGDILICNDVMYNIIRHVSGAYELYEVGKDIDKYDPYFLFRECNKMQVIGNIYESKKALEKNKS